MYSALRPLFFLLPPEAAHDWALKLLSIAGRAGLNPLLGTGVSDPYELLGLQFKNRVGLAAGLDKNGDYIDALGALGFGFIEIGTITPRPQDGNPKPRLFRLPKAEAIINRMGFNNKGVDYLVSRVERARYDGVLGINIGKNKDTSAEDAVIDYLHCLEKVYPLASYVTVNLSSPNTPGLRDLQFGDPLEQLLDKLKNRQAQLATHHGKRVPMLVKVAPDMADDDIVSVANALKKHEIDGLIATNTTIDRDDVSHLRYGNEAGGLSGKPLTAKAFRATGLFRQALGDDYPIVGVGGIMSSDDAVARINNGADLIQLYSGLIYKGPALLKHASRDISAV